VRPIHQREHHRLDNQSSEEVRQPEGSTSTQRETTGATNLGNLSQLYTPRGGGSSSVFGMARHNPTIRLPEFREAAEDPEKHLFICANIWEVK
jgi:hypothetical protein